MNEFNEQLDFGATILGFMDKNAKDQMNTMIPGQIVSYDPSRRTCTVQPAIRKRTETEVMEYPPLEDVPVHFVGGAGYSISHDLNEGDPGGIFFSMAAPF